MTCARKGQILLCKKQSDSTKKFSEANIINCLMDVFFNRLSAYIWVQIVLLFLPTCSFIRIRQTSYRGFSRKTKRN